MGDDRELQQTRIPMPDNESSQPPRLTAADLAHENVPNESPLEYPGDDRPPPQADRESPILNAGKIILLVLALIICIPLYLIYALGVYLVYNKDVSDMSTRGDVPPGVMPRFHQRVREFQGTAVHAAGLAARFNGRVVILLLIWLLINLRVRSLRKKIILGSELWQWTLLIVIIFCGYSVISMVTSLVSHYFTKACMRRYSAVYNAEGLRSSVNFTLLWILLILTWHFYFRTHEGFRETKNTHEIFQLGKWSPICYLMLSLCWILKTWLLLKWTTDAIFNRFSQRRIHDAAFQCYFLYRCILGAALHLRAPSSTADLEFERLLDYIEKSKVLVEDMKATLQPIESLTDKFNIIAYYLKRIAKVWPRDREDDATTPIREILRKIFGYPDSRIISIEDLLKFEMDEPDAQVLYEVLREGNPSGIVSYETFENWTVTAHRSNLMLGFTLIDLSGVADGLDKLMSGIAIITVIILWILLMDITTVTKLILVASPFLSGAFIFLGSFKPMFEGIIFTLVGHPFNVGDQCIIDEVQVEVREIRIWSTTFKKIPCGEELIHPNSVLVTKPISKFSLDLNDCIELNLDPTTDNSQIEELENRINRYIEACGDQFHGYCHMEIKGIGNSIRLAVHFKHAKKTPNVSDSQFYEKKKTQRSKLLLGLNQILKQLNIKAATN